MINNYINKILEGNCTDVMKQLPDNSIDLICTDPPYGLEFMNKSWDKAVPSVAVWKECLRILKPGAFAFIMSSPRLDVLSQMAIRLQGAGFRVDFTPIYWTYASGFPKSLNIGKAIDRKKGCERDVIGYKLGKSGDNLNIISRPKGKDNLNSKACGAYGIGAKQTNIEIPITIPKTDEAKELDGSYAGFQPKPAVEIIILAMKPLSEKTYVDQAIKNGKGITWLDNCRIPIAKNDRHEYGIDGDEGNPTLNCYGENNRVKYEQDKRGRFPANLLVSDDILNNGQETKSPKGFVNRQPKNGQTFNIETCGFDNTKNHISGFGDVGSFSRYFDLETWFNKTIENLPKEVKDVFPFLIVPKPNKSERNKGCENLESDIGHNRFDKCKTCGGYILQNPDRPSACKCEVPIRENNKIKGNFHPTVKPIKLMSYLITLGSRPNDLILDPFSGSGSTLIAAKLLSRNYIGIENKKEYIDICNKRLSVTQITKQEKSKSLFDF